MELIPRMTSRGTFITTSFYKVLCLALYVQDVFKKGKSPRGGNKLKLGLYHKFPIFKNSSQEIESKIIFHSNNKKSASGMM